MGHDDNDDNTDDDLYCGAAGDDWVSGGGIVFG